MRNQGCGMRILLLDDAPLVRDAMVGLLQGAFETPEIATGSVLSQAAPATDPRPDLIIANISGFAPADHPRLADLVARAAPAAVVAVDSHLRPGTLLAARAAGCRGYVPLTVAGGLIAAAFKVIAAGGEYYPPLAGAGTAAPPSTALSARQWDVARRLAEGKTNREIAGDLGIAVPTVKLHVHAILTAIGVRNRTEAALWARAAPALEA